MLWLHCDGNCIDKMFLVVLDYGCEEMFVTFTDMRSARLYASHMREVFSVQSTIFERPLMYKYF